MGFIIKNNKKVLKSLVLFFLAILLAFSAVPAEMVTTEVEAADVSTQLSEKQKELKRLEGLLADTKNKKSEILNKLKETEGKLSSLLNEKSRLEVSIGYSEEEIVLIEKLVVGYEEQLVELKNNYEKSCQLQKEKISQLCLVLQYIYETKDVSSLELFFSSDSFSEYVSKKEQAKNIISYQKIIVEQIEKTQAENEKSRKEYENALSFLQSYRNAIEEKKQSVAEDYKKLESLIAEYEATLEHAEEEYEAIDSIEKDYASEISKVKIDISELTEYLSDQFRWPFPDSQSYYISSYFGYRKDPFSSGKKEHHNGVDIVVPKGTPILASSGGIVTRSEYASVFGNVVVISHGNGLQTLYCHCSSRKVSVGDKVKQGDVIALVGSTGQSTGPHLHFAFILNGSYVNPNKYVPKKYF